MGISVAIGVIIKEGDREKVAVENKIFSDRAVAIYDQRLIYLPE